MKLEIKHLAPYLPYGLKVQYKGILNGKQISDYKKLEPKIEMAFESDMQLYNNWISEYPKIIEGEKVSEIKGIKFFKNYTSIHVGKRFSHSKTVFCNNIKPILRPLSDLTKEIEVNGVSSYLNELRKFNNTSEHIEYLCEYKGDLSLTNLEYNIIIKLLEWHFDIFGLIDKNLAIDINDGK